jgi:iron(III) transport system permease protein
VACLTALPVLALALVAAHGSGDLWPHLVGTVLPAAALETALYLAGVGAMALALGAGTAWLVAGFAFPGHRILSWALLLPMAMPTYIAAYAYLDVLHPVGPVQTLLRALLGIADPRGLQLPELRSLGGCILVSGFVLYPYVYLNARAAFAGQAADALWAARSVGATGWRLFLRIGLPMARPAIAVGVSLALMEALNDVGASEFLGVRTLTVSIYVTWLTRGSLEGAAQIALALLAFVVLLLSLERWGRRGTVFVGDPQPMDARPLDGARGWLASAACALPILCGFAVPASYIALKAWERVAEFGLPAELWGWIGNSAFYAGWGAMLTLGFGLLLAFAARMGQAAVLRLGSLGYALPGGVAAVGLIIGLGTIDDWLDRLWQALTGELAPVLLMGSGAALALAYAIRFLAVPAGGLDAAYARVGEDFDCAARGLGCRPGRLLWRIHLPMLRAPLLAAGLIVFADAMKELPATLLLRPVNVETLATALYGEAVRGTYEDGAVAALALIVIAMLPAVLLAHLGPDGRTARASERVASRSARRDDRTVTGPHGAFRAADASDGAMPPQRAARRRGADAPERAGVSPGGALPDTGRLAG